MTRARITLLARSDCHLCDAAVEVIRRVAAELGTGWEPVDVDGDPRLRAEYGDRVPVVLIDGIEHASFSVQEQQLRAALRG